MNVSKVACLLLLVHMGLAEGENAAGSLITFLDTNKDGLISFQELKDHVGKKPDFAGWEAAFKEADANQDGQLELKELEALLACHQARAGRLVCKLRLYSSKVDSAATLNETNGTSLQDEHLSLFIEWLAEKSMELANSRVAQKRLSVLALSVSIGERLGFSITPAFVTNTKLKDYPLTWWVLLSTAHWVLRICENHGATMPNAWILLEDVCAVSDGLARYLIYGCNMLTILWGDLEAAIAFYLGTLSMLHIWGFINLSFKLRCAFYPWHIKCPSLLRLPLRPKICAEFIFSLIALCVMLVFMKMRALDTVAFLSFSGIQLVYAILEEFFECPREQIFSSFWWKDDAEMELVEFFEFFCTCNAALPWRVQRMFYSVFKAYFEGSELSDEQKCTMLHGLAELFKQIDTDNTGKISGKEFRDFCRKFKGEYKELVNKVCLSMKLKRLSIAAGVDEKLMIPSDRMLKSGRWT